MASGQNGSGWLVHDCVFFADDNIAMAHGQPTTCKYHSYDYPPAPPGGTPSKYPPFLWKQGGVFYWDGHAGLERDPWPTYPLAAGAYSYVRPADGYRLQNGCGPPPVQSREMSAIIAYMAHLLYAQRGVDAIQLVPNHQVPPWRPPGS
jgi:hypothetical protein